MSRESETRPAEWAEYPVQWPGIPHAQAVKVAADQSSYHFNHWGPGHPWRRERFQLEYYIQHGYVIMPGLAVEEGL